MTERYIRKLIATGRIHEFYVSSQWRKLRREVLAEDHNECVICKSNGKYTRANHVHHVNYVRLHPELALSKTYVDGKGQVKRNLISVCHNCHETVCHPERLRKAKPEPWAEDWS